MLRQASNYIRSKDRNESYRPPDTYILIHDFTLSWNEHIPLTVAKSCKTLGLVKRTLGPYKLSVKETAYKTLV